MSRIVIHNYLPAHDDDNKDLSPEVMEALMQTGSLTHRLVKIIWTLPPEDLKLLAKSNIKYVSALATERLKGGRL
jgi:hypothetical protein